MDIVVRYFLEWVACINQVMLGFIPSISSSVTLPPEMLGINPSMTGYSSAQKCQTTFEKPRGEGAAASPKPQENPPQERQNVGPQIAAGQKPWERKKLEGGAFSNCSTAGAIARRILFGANDFAIARRAQTGL